MKRTVLAYTAALAGSLALAYWSWTHEPEAAQTTDVVVLDTQADSITRIAYKSDEIDVNMVRRDDALGSYFWVELTKQVSSTPPPPKPGDHVGDGPPGRDGEDMDAHDHGHDHDHGAQGSEPEPPPSEKAEPAETDGTAKADSPTTPDEPTAKATAADKPDAPAAPNDDTDKPSEEVNADADEAEPSEAIEPEPKRMTFKGGEAVDEVLQSLAPLQAKRVLTSVDADRLEEFGLGDDAAVLTIEREGRDPLRYEVGELMFGGRTAYMRDTADDRVFVVDAKLVRILKDADLRLIERRLLAAEPPEVTRVNLLVGGTQASFVQQNADDVQAAYWARDGQEDRDEAADTWIKKLLRLRATDSTPAEDAALIGAQERFAVATVTRKGETTRIVVLEVPSASEGTSTWWARSDFARATVRLYDHLASDLAATVGDLGDGPATP